MKKYRVKSTLKPGHFGATIGVTYKLQERFLYIFWLSCVTDDDKQKLQEWCDELNTKPHITKK